MDGWMDGYQTEIVSTLSVTMGRMKCQTVKGWKLLLSISCDLVPTENYLLQSHEDSVPTIESDIHAVSEKIRCNGLVCKGSAVTSLTTTWNPRWWIHFLFPLPMLKGIQACDVHQLRHSSGGLFSIRSWDGLSGCSWCLSLLLQSDVDTITADEGKWLSACLCQISCCCVCVDSQTCCHPVIHFMENWLTSCFFLSFPRRGKRLHYDVSCSTDIVSQLIYSSCRFHI